MMTLKQVQKLIDTYDEMMPGVKEQKITKENEASIYFPLLFTLLDYVRDKDLFYYMYSATKPEVDKLCGKVEE